MHSKDATIDDAVLRVWKREAAVVVGALTRIVRDLSLAEEIAQDALVAALERWPRDGVPDNPGAWLMTTAKNRALNHRKRAHRETSFDDGDDHDEDAPRAAASAQSQEEQVRDDVLRLLFASCHPALPADARVALTLRVVAGLTTAEIARAFLSTESAIAQRIVRAKKTLGEVGGGVDDIPADEMAARLQSVLDVVYLTFNEGYSATDGADLVKTELVDEALRLARLLAAVAPDEPEVHALVALTHLQACRDRARTKDGEPVLLADQDRSLWDRARIDVGLRALEQADALVDDEAQRGAFHLQATIAACHAIAKSVDDTDWATIAALYRALYAIQPSPVVELNRAIAVSRAEGPAAGLRILDDLARHRKLADYHWLPAARADLLLKLGKKKEARAEFDRAAKLATHPKQRERLLARAKAALD